MQVINIKKTEWDLSPLLNGDDDQMIDEKRKEIEEKSYEFINKWKKRDDYLHEPKVLKEALDEYEEWMRKFGTDWDEGYYFWLRTKQDQNNSKLKAKSNKIKEFSKKILNDIQFFNLNIAKIPEKEQSKFLKYEGLDKYRYYLKRAFMRAKHLLSEQEEKILTLKKDTSYSNWVKMTSGFLSKEEREVLLENGKKEIKFFSEIRKLIDNNNKDVRDSAALAFNDILRKNVEVAEAEVNSILADKKINDELRKMPRPDYARHLSDDIDSKIVDMLVESVSERFDIPKKFYELKAKILGLKKLEYHERNVQYGKIDKKYSYKEAVELVYDVLNDIDGKFSDILRKFSKNGQIDVYPKKGKSDGAFCIYWLITQPTYILLNHADKLEDVLTLAHELGHGINNELMKEKQNSLYFETPLSTAEVASTFMEDFVLQGLLKEADDELRLSLLMKKLGDDVSTIFRQIACYKFEQELHKEFKEKGYLSKEEIGKIFQKHMRAYMGDFVEQSDGSENWWVFWSHIRSYFYVYSYASGLLISKSLQNSVKKNPAFIEKVKEFLSAGTSDSPKNIFLKLGIDISKKEFWDSGIKEIEFLLKETEELAKKLGKI